MLMVLHAGSESSSQLLVDIFRYALHYAYHVQILTEMWHVVCALNFFKSRWPHDD